MTQRRLGASRTRHFLAAFDAEPLNEGPVAAAISQFLVAAADSET